MLSFIPIQLKTIPCAVVILEFLHFVILIYCIRSYIKILPKPRIKRKEYKKNRITNLITIFNIKDVYSFLKKMPENDAWLKDKIFEFYMSKYR